MLTLTKQTLFIKKGMPVEYIVRPRDRYYKVKEVLPFDETIEPERVLADPNTYDKESVNQFSEWAREGNWIISMGADHPRHFIYMLVKNALATVVKTETVEIWKPKQERMF